MASGRSGNTVQQNQQAPLPVLHSWIFPAHPPQCQLGHQFVAHAAKSFAGKLPFTNLDLHREVSLTFFFLMYIQM